MNCVEALGLLEALHDGALDSTTARNVREHLSICLSCRAELEQLRLVSSVLRKSVLPAASDDIDARVMSAFRQKHRQPKPSPWRFLDFGILAGSVSIPKSAMAVAVLLIIVALGVALKIGMMTATPIVVNMTPPAPVPMGTAPVSVAASGEQFKIVEVPVIREKVRTVYVNPKSGGTRRNESSADRYPNGGDVAMTASVSERGYFTRVNLSGFVPSTEMRTKVISEVKENEK